MILPEFGRDRNLNQRNGLDHGDSSPELLKVAMVGAGPDFKKGKTVSAGLQSIDVCPTACELLGVEAEFANGKVMREVFAR
jgi:arylsulfatase A-like enzyme